MDLAANTILVGLLYGCEDFVNFRNQSLVFLKRL